MKTRFWLLVLSVALFAGCAERPLLKDYPRTQIERPYTLLAGTNSVDISVPFRYSQDKTGSRFPFPFPVPIYRTALSNDWTLNFAPLPLSFSRQLTYSKEQMWGITFGVGGGFYSRGNTTTVVLAPQVELFQRTRLGQRLAWTSSLDGTASYRTQGVPWEWSAGVTTGPYFQVLDHIALSPRVGAYLNYGFTYTLYGDSGIEPELSTQFVVPLGATAEWSVHRRWDIGVSYFFHGIGYSNGYLAHVTTVRMIHYW